MNITDSNLLRTIRSRRDLASLNAKIKPVTPVNDPVFGNEPLRDNDAHSRRDSRQHPLQLPIKRKGFGFGANALDKALQQDSRTDGLPLNALHEIHAAKADDNISAAAFTVLMAQRARLASDHPDRPILWARERHSAKRLGFIYPPGLVALGLDPDSLIYVAGDDPIAVLRAGADAARCGALAAVIIELTGPKPRGWDLTASRRLSLFAQKSGVTILCLRGDAPHMASAAYSRFRIASAPSAPLEANAPGHASFDVTLERHRGGVNTHSARLEWNVDQKYFKDLDCSAARPAANTATKDTRAPNPYPADIGASPAVSAIGTDRPNICRIA